MKVTKYLPILAVCLMTTGCNSKKEAVLTSGIDLANLDTTAMPGTSFYQYACGGWVKDHPLTDEYSRFGSFDMLHEKSREQLKELIAELAAKKDNAPGSAAQKVGDLYNIAMDSVKLNKEGAAPIKEEMAKVTNRAKKSGSLAEMLVGADVFIGVSAPGAVTIDMVKTMNKDAIIFACANPIPEIFPDDAKAGGAKVISTGRSDFPNQINNVLAFPGIFRGAFDVRASDINDEMKIAASKALADLITDEELSPEYIIPKAFDKRVGPAVAKAVAEAAKATGVARI